MKEQSLTASLKVQAIQRFTSTATAVEDLAAIQDGRLTDSLSKFLSDAVGGSAEDGKKKKKDKSKVEEMLVVSEPKLGELACTTPHMVQLTPQPRRSSPPCPSPSCPTRPRKTSTEVSDSSLPRSWAVLSKRT